MAANSQRYLKNAVSTEMYLKITRNWEAQVHLNKFKEQERADNTVEPSSSTSVKKNQPPKKKLYKAHKQTRRDLIYAEIADMARGINSAYRAIDKKMKMREQNLDKDAQEEEEAMEE